VLGRLCDQARVRARDLGIRSRELHDRARDREAAPSLDSALRAITDMAVIAELKRQSPSRGVLRGEMNIVDRARSYAEGGASALSVLTEPHAFGGSNQDLVAIREAVPLPVLKKDFHVEPLQLWEARALEASAALLIARALGPDGLRRMMDAAQEAAIEPVVEVRDEWELEWAVEAGASLVGVNRRNLETLAMEDDVPRRLLPRIPPACLAISESGIASRADVEEAATLGADAVLVGSSLSVADEAAASVEQLCGVARRPREEAW
jgi:indole-3-glycerol phosphate synthase